MAEGKKHKTGDSTGRTGGKEAQARAEKAAVVLALAGEPGNGPCLGDEELALFASGGGSRMEKAKWLQHVGLCPTCREQWLLVRQSLEHQGRERGRLYRLSVFRSLRSLRSIGLTLAAAASVAVYLQIVKAPGPLPEPRTFAPQQSTPAPSAPPAAIKMKETKHQNAVQPAAPAAPAEKAPAPPPPPAAALETPQGKGTLSSPVSEKPEARSSSSPKAGPPVDKAPPARTVEADSVEEKEELPRKSAAPRPDPAPRATGSLPQPAPTAAPSPPPAELSTSPWPSEQESAAPADQIVKPGGRAAPAPKAAGRQELIERRVLQGALPARIAEDRTEMAGQSPATDEVTPWFADLRQACETRPDDPKVWEDLAGRGQRLRVSGGDTEHDLASLLGLVKGIRGADDAEARCPRILEKIERMTRSDGE